MEFQSQRDRKRPGSSGCSILAIMTKCTLRNHCLPQSKGERDSGFACNLDFFFPKEHVFSGEKIELGNSSRGNKLSKPEWK